MDNPKVKKDDLIILTSSQNGLQSHVGKTLKVSTCFYNGYFNVIDPKTNKNVGAVFNTSPADTYKLADRNSQIEAFKDQIAEKENELKELKSEVEFLEKYESKEDFVAEKVDAILTAYSAKGSKKARTGAIAQILKELKKSDML